MQTNPREEREIRNSMVLPPGEYDFEVNGAKEGVSKNNNDMITLTLRIFPHDGGSPRLINDWLVSGSTMGDLKLNRFCHATGLQGAYFADELTAFACDGATGRVKLTIEGSEKYGDQNRVRDYIVEIIADEQPKDPPPQGVPAAQTRRAMQKAHEAEEVTAPYTEQSVHLIPDDDVPF